MSICGAVLRSFVVFDRPRLTHIISITHRLVWVCFLNCEKQFATLKIPLCCARNPFALYQNGNKKSTFHPRHPEIYRKVNSDEFFNPVFGGTPSVWHHNLKIPPISYILKINYHTPTQEKFCFLSYKIRYNPEHLPTLESHVREQAKGNTYDLEVNLAVLKSYQFDPSLMNLEITNLILLKALTNLPHTDFTLCKCLLLPVQMDDPTISDIVDLADILEKCDFELFWSKILSTPDMIVNVKGFFDSIRKFVCNVINITFQTISSQYLRRLLGDVDGNDMTFSFSHTKYPPA